MDINSLAKSITIWLESRQFSTCNASNVRKLDKRASKNTDKLPFKRHCSKKQDINTVNLRQNFADPVKSRSRINEYQYFEVVLK